MISWLISLRILIGPVPYGLYAASILVVVALIVTRPTRQLSRRRWLLRVLIASAIAAVIGLLAGWLASDVFDVFGVSLTYVVRAWICALAVGTVIAIISMVRARWWRIIGSALAALLFLATAAVGVNKDFGQFTTVGDALGLNEYPAITLPAVTPSALTVPVPAAWSPPPGMPAKGRIGSVHIPPTRSGFTARSAVVYLPPAALVPNPPKLPVVVALTGQPGQPSNFFRAGDFGTLMDTFASTHGGLAPIIVAPDQLGASAHNPMCVDSALGNSRTYINVDVVDWIRSHLNVTTERTGWGVIGYSEGGTCAIQFGAEYPNIFGSIIDVSGEVAQSNGDRQQTIDRGFAGSVAAYTAATPVALLAAHAPYLDTTAIFAVGQDDQRFQLQQTAVSSAARSAGMNVTTLLSPGSAHDWNTVRFGFSKGMGMITGRLGLK
ncbi:MAG: alpha/beta hydrolase [Lacisediminihabitans sp.]